jgi:phosphoribosylformylglycinamidine (FGAM) synthase PurS component
VHQLLRKLANAVDDGTLSYVQLMVKAKASETAAEDIAEAARACQANPTVKTN